MQLFYLVIMWLLTKMLTCNGCHNYRQLNIAEADYQLGFYLNGVFYPNGSFVSRVDIMEYESALHCITDRYDCCYHGYVRIGEFYFPDGHRVPIQSNVSRGYYRDRGDRFVRLNRRPDGIIIGCFRCEIPDTNGTLVNLFINIADQQTLMCIEMCKHSKSFNSSDWYSNFIKSENIMKAFEYCCHCHYPIISATSKCEDNNECDGDSRSLAKCRSTAQ